MTIKNAPKFLLQNIGIRQTVAKNIFWLMIGEGALRLSAFLLIIYAIRVLGPVEFGKFSFALATASLFVIFSDFGLSEIITRDFAQDKEEEKKFSAILSLKIILSIGTLLIIAASSFFIVSDPLIRIIMWLLGGYIIFDSFNAILCAFFRARMLMEYEAWIKIFQAALLAAVGFFFIISFPSAVNLSLSYLIVSFIVLILLLFFFSFRIQAIKIVWDMDTWKKFLGKSWPLGFAMIFGMIYIYIDSVMLGFWGKIAEVGLYSAAYKITGIPLILMTLISMGFYPALSKFFRESKEKLQKLWNYQMEIMIVLALPMMAGGILLASKIISFFYPPSYTPSIPVFRLLVLVAGINFLYVSYNMILVIFNQQKKHFWICLVTSATNIVLNFILIPRYSFYGAGLATLICYIILFILEIEFSRRYTSIAIFNLRLTKVLLAAVVSSIIMSMIILLPMVYHNCNFIGLFLIGTAVYFIALTLFYKLFKLYAYLSS